MLLKFALKKILLFGEQEVGWGVFLNIVKSQLLETGCWFFFFWLTSAVVSVNVLPTIAATWKSWLLLWGSQSGPTFGWWSSRLLQIRWICGYIWIGSVAFQLWSIIRTLHAKYLFLSIPRQKLRYVLLTTSLLTCRSLSTVKIIPKAFGPTESGVRLQKIGMMSWETMVNELRGKSLILGGTIFIQQWLTS